MMTPPLERSIMKYFVGFFKAKVYETYFRCLGKDGYTSTTHVPLSSVHGKLSVYTHIYLHIING